MCVEDAHDEGDDSRYTETKERTADDELMSPLGVCPVEVSVGNGEETEGRNGYSACRHIILWDWVVSKGRVLLRRGNRRHDKDDGDDREWERVEDLSSFIIFVKLVMAQYNIQ